MTPEPPLEYMLDQPSSFPAGRDELAAIVARSTRRRTRIAAAGMAGTLLVGAVGGWVIANGSHNDNRVMASASSPTTTIPKPEAGVAVASGGRVSGSYGPAGPSMKRIFARTTPDGVTVRGFETTKPTMPPDVSKCMVFPDFQSELSTAGMANPGVPGFATSSPLSGSIDVMGQAEQAPVWVATTHSGTGITLVRANFSDGSTDEMAPVNGWAVLAHGAATMPAYDAPVTATVEGLDQQGKVVATQKLDQKAPGVPSKIPAPDCVPPLTKVCPPPPAATPPPAAKTPPPPGVGVQCSITQQGGSVVTGNSGSSAGGQPAAPVTTVSTSPPAT